MNEYIINIPQLQSFKKRLGGFFVWILGWVMWGYLLFPLITLANWLQGNYKVINEMRWFGGYKSLLELLEIYGITLAILAGIWIIWAIVGILCRSKFRHYQNVSDEEICHFYQVNQNDVILHRQKSLVTVVFDDYGQILEFRN